MEALETWHVAALDRAKVIVIHEGPGPDGRTYKDGLHQHTICICDDEEGKAAEYAKLIAAAPETARRLEAAEAQITQLLELLEGAQKALRKAYPYVGEHEDSVFVGEWLDEVSEWLAPYTNEDAEREERILEDSEARICYDRF